MQCEDCRYHDSFSHACCNGLSPKVAEFTNNDDSCDEWEEDETLSEL